MDTTALAANVIARLNARDLEGLRAAIADEIVDEIVPIGRFEGREAVLGFFREMLEAFADFHVEIERIQTDDRRAVVQWRNQGTFTGRPFLGLLANGRCAEVRGVDIMEFEHGLMVKNTIYYDAATLARGLGVLPPARSRRESAMTAMFNLGVRARAVLRSRTIGS